MSLDLKPVQVRLPNDVYDVLKMLADANDHDLGEEAREILTEALLGKIHALKILAERLSASSEWLRFDKTIAPYEDYETPDLRAGFVYVIRIGERFKIGKAIDWRKRISNAMFPEPPEIICIIETDDRHGLERELHIKHSDVRVHGEWFELQKSHINELLQSQRIVEHA